MKSLKVVELFAGVGGFRLGLEKSGHKTVWANQWEPKIKPQYAYNCYKNHFPNDTFENINVDINNVEINEIPEHDLLVGGFPCQDYSVATLRAKGIEGKRGVLWWNIEKILRKKRPSYVLLENVDRLIKSPKIQRGKDFGVILSCLYNLGYCIEWRVIDSSEYGFPQRRKRVFMFAAKKNTKWYNNMSQYYQDNDFIDDRGFFSNEFKVEKPELCSEIKVKTIKDTKKISDSFSYNFLNSGFLFNNTLKTQKVVPSYNGEKKTLKDILVKDVDKRYFIDEKEEIDKWKEKKSAKKKPVKRSDGKIFIWSEGKMSFPDSINRPSRTIVTSSGGTGPSRFKHIILDPWEKKLRILTPEEVELLCGFPMKWTNTGMPENWRYFCMGNALIVGLIEKMGKTLSK
jgi:DNA (cytosine-5)-methyltransferase 1